MSDGAGNPTEAVPVVAADIGQSEGSLLRELVGDREEDVGDDSGSEQRGGWDGGGGRLWRRCSRSGTQRERLSIS